MLEDLPVPTGEKLCLFMQRAAELSKEDFDILQAAIDNPHWSHIGLANALKARGFVIGETLVLKHRKKKCRCAR